MFRTSFLSAAATIIAAGALAVPAGAGAATSPISYDAFLASARAPFKHKQLFTSPRVNNGAIFVYMRNSLNGYQFGWHEGPGTLHPVAVLNGNGVAQGVDDAAWRTYRLADVLAANNDPVKAANAASGNPWLHPAVTLTRNDADPSAAYNVDASIETLQHRGASLYICDNALLGLAQKIVAAGAAGGRSSGAVYTDLQAHLVPGGMLVPAGVTTVDALQQEHFTLYDAGV
ncbi:MAG TPA: hypothetical protein VGN14_06785 [Candidatus Elarobacter sp.]|jgi:intracellular sulfur oxidation DsrE/DsrF family protein